MQIITNWISKLMMYLKFMCICDSCFSCCEISEGYGTPEKI